MGSGVTFRADPASIKVPAPSTGQEAGQILAPALLIKYL